jgi:hypothetical protein
MKRSTKVYLAMSIVSVMALAVGATATTAVAVPPHRHCMLTPQGYVEVGPRVFQNAPEGAFLQFHNHVHVSDVPTTIVPIFDPAIPCSSLNP